MERPPKLTIGVALYNNGRTISESLDSALNQTFTDFKIIISDDGSTDTSYDIVNEYAKKDKRITVIRQSTNLGPYENWHELSKNVSSPYFFWLPPDDIIHPQFFENAIKIHESNPDAMLVYPKAVFMSHDGKISTESADSDIVTSNLILQERLIKLAWKTYACTAVYGVYKTKVLKHFPLHEKIIGLDLLLLFTTAIHGDILSTSEVLFYRRRREEKNPEETINRYISWGLYHPTRHSPYALFAIKHFNAVLKAKNISYKNKVRIIYDLTLVFKEKFYLSKKEIFFQLFDIILPSRLRNKKTIGN